MTNFALPSHVSKSWVVSVESSTGEVLSPADFEFFGAATAPGAGAVAMRSSPGESQTVLTLSPLGLAGTWHYSIFCRQKMTAVTWQVAAGQISVTPSPCLAQPSLDPDPLLLTAMLDPQTLQVTVSLGDSVAATAAAAQQATQAAANAEAAQTQAEQAADDAQTSQAAAAQSAANAEAAQTQAAQAAADAQTSQAAAAQSAANAEAAQTQAAQAADDAQTSQAAAAQSAANAEAAQTQAAQEASKAEAAQAKAEQEAAVAVEMGWSRGYPVVSFNVSDSLSEIWAKLAAVAACQAVAIDAEGSFDGGRLTALIGGAPVCGASKLVLRSKNGYFRKGGEFCQKVFPSVRELWVYQTSGNSLWGGVNVDYLEVQLLNETDTNWGTYLNSGVYKAVVVHAKTIDTSVYCPMYGMNNGNVARFFDVKEQPNVSYFFKSYRVSDSSQLAAGAVPTEIWSKAEVAVETFCNSWALPEIYLPEALPKLKTAEKMFNNCRLSAEYLLKLLPTLPTWTDGADHLLTIGIHVDHQSDAELRAAIDAAVARGWTVIEQWNGSATAATFALRPAPPLPVYAKDDTFSDSEGNEQRNLSWCHQITSPDGKEPEELGYTLFESVEAAREYFGLPEEETKPTE